jgi:glycogen(starch) synthase
LSSPTSGPARTVDPRRFSVVINTDDRADSLAVTLDSLRYLDHPSFEVIVVRGPTPDGTGEVLARYEGLVKVGHCPHRNLSESRNIGVALAGGEIVAFIDDDAYPDPQWLNRLDEAYDNGEVAGAGGPVWDWTGARLQVLYSMANRLGDVWVENRPGIDPSWLLSRPGTAEFTYPIGTNTSFRRQRLVEIGGFDEQFEYGWDEVDVCHRLIEAGWVVRVLEDGFVYHKSLPSEIRGQNRATRNMRVLLKNKAYYTFKHGSGVVPLSDIVSSLAAYAEHYRDEMKSNVAKGLLTESDLEQFEEDVAAGFDLGHAAWQSGRDRRRPAPWFAEQQQRFVAFPTLRPRSDKLHLCFLSVEYPPVPVNGIGRVVHELATGLGQMGHEVHVLTMGSDLDRIDFEEGVWVHRMVPRPHPLPEGIEVPAGLWNYSATLGDEALRIHAHRPVDLVQAPNWSTEGIAVLLDGRLPLVVGLYTPLATVAAMDEPIAQALAARDPEIVNLIELERLTYSKAPHFLACGPAIVGEIEAAYGVTLGPDRCGFVAHGLSDLAGSVEPTRWPGRINVLFVGRLEDRKGIDILLAAVPELVRRHSDVGFTIVGEDSRPMTDGLTHRQRFEASTAWPEVADHVRFLGRVDDDELHGLYAGCDVFVAPSRFESFGLILLEAMMFAKPLVASDIGGMAEIVVEGENGRLVPPGDSRALGDAIDRLVSSADLRQRFGSASRAIYERRYGRDSMVEGALRFYCDILGRPVPDAGVTPTRIFEPAPSRPIDEYAAPAPQPVPPPVVLGQSGLAAAPTEPGSTLSGLPPELVESLRCPRCGAQITVVPFCVTAGGGVKTGQLLCTGADGIVGGIDQFKYDFLDPPNGARPPDKPRVVPELGERRIPADDEHVEAQGTWHPYTAGSLYSLGVVGDSLVLDAPFTDALVRMQCQPGGGVADIFIDGQPVVTVDLFQPEGSEMRTVRVAADLDFAERQLAVRARGSSHPEALAGHIIVEEFVLYGPAGPGSQFGPPLPLNRGNPYSPYVDRWLDDLPAGELVLEFGGGDRRLCRPGHINVEFLKFELADAYADIHAIPFADDTFGAVWSQAVFEHVANPFAAAAELVRVTRPGGLVMTEVAFMQPLHAVPYHFFNMTTWGVQELFSSCEILECDWFGELSTTVDWLVRAVGLPAKVAPAELAELTERFRSYDALVSHDDLRPAASAVYLVARKRG